MEDRDMKRRTKQRAPKKHIFNYISFFDGKNDESNKVVKKKDKRKALFITVTTALLIVISAIVAYKTSNYYQGNNREDVSISFTNDNADYKTIITRDNYGNTYVKIKWTGTIINNGKNSINFVDCNVKENPEYRGAFYSGDNVVNKDDIQKDSNKSFPLEVKAGETTKLSFNINTKISDEHELKVLEDNKLINKEIEYSKIKKVLLDNGIDIIGNWLDVAESNDIKYATSYMNQYEVKKLKYEIELYTSNGDRQKYASELDTLEGLSYEDQSN